MHTRPMADSEGTFDAWKIATIDRADGSRVPWSCSKCGGGPVYYRTWESSCGGYEDVQYHCHDCDRKWWVEGADA